MTVSYRKQFTETLANLFLAEFDNFEEGIYTISKKAGVSYDLLVRYLSGEDYPSTQTAARIGKSFSILKNDPNASFGFLQLATAARNELIETSSQSEQYNNMVELDKQIQEYKQPLDMQTELNHTENEISELLYLLFQRSKLGIEKGWLPPAVYNKMFENISENNAYVSFCSICSAKEIDPYVELYAISYTLDLFESFAS
ncbi:hypothetical protein [Thermosynechococcus sp. FA-CM-4201]